MTTDSMTPAEPPEARPLTEQEIDQLRVAVEERAMGAGRPHIRPLATVDVRAFRRLLATLDASRARTDLVTRIEGLEAAITGFFDAHRAYLTHISRPMNPDEEPDFGPWNDWRAAEARLAGLVGYGKLAATPSGEPHAE